MLLAATALGDVYELLFFVFNIYVLELNAKYENNCVVLDRMRGLGSDSTQCVA